MTISSCKLLAVAAATSAMLCCSYPARGTSLEIPAAVDGQRHPVTVEDLITLREIGGMLGSGLSVSPDGNYAAFEMHQANIAANDYKVAWLVASTLRQSVPINVGDGGNPILFRAIQPGGRVVGAWVSEYAKWSPDSRGIAYRKKVNGETQIWWSSRDGKKKEQLTHSAADVDAFRWDPDGARLFFTTDADRVELREAEASRYRNGHVFDYEKDWSTIDAKPFYPPHLLTGGRPRVWVLDVASRTERPATDEELAEFEQLQLTAAPLATVPNARKVARSDDRSHVAWMQPDDPDKQGRNPPLTLYASLAAHGSNPVRCSADECTGIFDLTKLLREGLHWNAAHDEIFFVRKEGMGYPKRSLYGWRVGQDRVRRIFTTDEWVSDCSIVRGKAICFRESPTYPRTIIAIDLADSSVETLVDPNPEFRNVTLGDAELLEWKNSLGYETFGYIVWPPNYVPGRRYPLVFVGYRPRYALRGGIGDEYPVHLLAKAGFVVFLYDKPTPHVAEQIYSDRLEIAKARWQEPDLFDVRVSLATFESAVQILDEKGLIDRTRMAVTGLSAGVSDVNYSLIHSDLFAAAITSSCEWAPSGYFLTGVSGDFLRKYRQVIGAGPNGGPDGFLWPHLSLALNVKRVRAPLLVNAGSDEHPWALEEIVTLIEHGKPVEMVVHPNEGHIKWQPAHRLAIYKRNIDWLNFWLRDVEDSSPEKADQYSRWHGLRDKHIGQEAARVATKASN